MGKINVAWRLAMATVGQNFTKDEHANGWPETLKHWQLAALQYPYARGEAARNRLANARAGDILKACQSGELPHTVTTHIPAPAKPSAPLRSPFASAEWQSRDGFTFGGMPARIGYTATGSPRKPVTTYPYHVTAADFAAWLDAQGEKPSEHIAAWFDAVGVPQAGAIAPSAEPVATKKSKEERQDERLQMCIDAGLKMPTCAVGRMPDGIGKVAEEMAGVKRQTFVPDVRAALKRKIERERPKPRLVPPKR